MQASEKSRDATIYSIIAALVVANLVLDAFTPVGLASWAFYIVPLALCAFQTRPWFAPVTALVISVLLVVGYEISPPGIDPRYGMVNRLIGFISIWTVAILVQRLLAEKIHAAHLAWVHQGKMHLNASMLGDKDVQALGKSLMKALGEYTGAQVGVAYRLDRGRLVRVGTFASGAGAAGAPESIEPGEGIPGQVLASSKPMVVCDLPADYLRVTSATGAAAPTQLLVAPFLEDGRATGVIELGFVTRDRDLSRPLALLQLAGDSIGSNLRSALYRQRLQELLQQTQAQAEELQAQQEELRVNNEELEEQGNALRASQARLESQHAEIEEANVRLEEQTQRLERQKQELVLAQQAITENARALERTSQYKSEFLANMSHELRTPLNSALILAKLLADNGAGNLDEEQVRYAKTIYASNNDLLTLINDILDLSKIEAGQVRLTPEEVTMEQVLEPLRAMFEPVAAERKVALRIERAGNAPARLVTDLQRLHQVLKNLLSNAFKFTSRGEVVLQVSAPEEGRVAFAVRDTGIGIPEKEHGAIFEAFKQADSTNSRQYGGTGLGLSISRELAGLLGGYISLRSSPGLGSTFTLDMGQVLKPPKDRTPAPAVPPQAAAAAAPGAPAAQPAAVARGPHIDDDREGKGTRGRTIVVVEDDPRFARILYDLAHELGFDCVHCSTASEGYEMARSLKPAGMVLDVSLPGESGLSLLDRMKHDPAVRHIPVHMVSVDDHSQAALGMGAVGYALKPVPREELVKAIGRLESRLRKRVSRVLVVEDDAALRDSIARLLHADNVEISAVGTVGEALARVEAEEFDVVVTDLALPDAPGYELLEKLATGERHALLPVIVYTGRALSREEETRLRRYSRSIIIKGARSPERLLDEVTLFLHRVESSLPPDKQNILRRARQRDAAFEGRHVLIAEDDVRNIFALTRVLEPLGAQVEIARNGEEAVQRAMRGGIDLVLMDIMMPVKDGLQAMREIRAVAELKELPIIAITAKAMADDRRDCIAAGASDYIAKPIDVDQLLSLCRVWLSK